MIDPGSITAIGISLAAVATAVINARSSVSKEEHSRLQIRVQTLETDKTALEREREELRKELYDTREELHKTRVELATVLAELRAFRGH